MIGAHQVTVDEAIEAAERARKSSLAARFRLFHRENPVVYKLLVQFARELKGKGHASAGIALIWERMRWEVMLSTTTDPFKLNNDYRSRYARLIMEQEPDLAGFFETRALRRV